LLWFGIESLQQLVAKSGGWADGPEADGQTAATGGSANATGTQIFAFPVALPSGELT